MPDSISRRILATPFFAYLLLSSTGLAGDESNTTVPLPETPRPAAAQVIADGQYDTHLRAAQQAEQDGLRGKAAREYTDAWKESAQHIETGFKAAQIWAELQDWIRAAGILSTLAGGASDSKFTAQSRELLNKVQPKAEPLYQAEIRRIKDLIVQGQWNDAMSAARGLIDLWPARPEAFFELARVSSANNDVPGARAAIVQAAKFGKVNLDVIVLDPLFENTLKDVQFTQFLTDMYGEVAVSRAQSASKAWGEALQQEKTRKPPTPHQTALEAKLADPQILASAEIDANARTLLILDPANATAKKALETLKQRKEFKQSLCGKWIIGWETEKKSGGLHISDVSDDEIAIEGEFSYHEDRAKFQGKIPSQRFSLIGLTGHGVKLSVAGIFSGRDANATDKNIESKTAVLESGKRTFLRISSDKGTVDCWFIKKE